MRPVIRGPRPVDDENKDIIFTAYPNARREMIGRLGEYCSYCEMQLDASLAIEHVRPKKPEGAAAVMVDRELDWENFLLACTNCNSTKGDDEIVLADYVWPDRDNTFRAIKYAEGGVVSAAENIQSDKALKLIKLVGLDRTPDTSSASDRRWSNRREAWDIANHARRRLEKVDFVELREQIVETAQAKGYWSMWMVVFEDDHDMLKRLIAAFPGTAADCFHVESGYVAIARNGGQC